MIMLMKFSLNFKNSASKFHLNSIFSAPQPILSKNCTLTISSFTFSPENFHKASKNIIFIAHHKKIQKRGKRLHAKIKKIFEKWEVHTHAENFHMKINFLVSSTSFCSFLWWHEKFLSTIMMNIDIKSTRRFHALFSWVEISVY